jgi:hypothetical protein
MIHASFLDDRAVLALGGPEARDFLQGLTTNDVTTVAEEQPVYTALLTPQGKILFDFFVVPDAEGRLLIDCAASRATDLMKRLTLYKLRAKVKIAHPTDLALAAAWDDNGAFEIPGDVVRFRDPRHPSLGVRMIGARNALANAIGGLAASDYQLHRLVLGVPDSADLTPDSVFALDAGLEELNGVSFKKGCFIGQEVTARMKHRAAARRRFFVAEFAGEAPAPGTPIISEERELATFATGANGRALALVRLDRWAEAEAKRAPVTADGREVQLNKPEWLHV